MAGCAKGWGLGEILAKSSAWKPIAHHSNGLDTWSLGLSDFNMTYINHVTSLRAFQAKTRLEDTKSSLTLHPSPHLMPR